MPNARGAVALREMPDRRDSPRSSKSARGPVAGTSTASNAAVEIKGSAKLIELNYASASEAAAGGPGPAGYFVRDLWGAGQRSGVGDGVGVTPLRTGYQR
jgi:hypothetical protein